MPSKQREYLTAIWVDKGIIQLIDVDGVIRCYRQRGLRQLKPAVINKLVASDRLVKNWDCFKELPSNYTISFEDEEIQGKARATYPNLEKLKNLK